MNIEARTDEELGELSYYLSQFNFEVIYSPGKYNLEADSLSRNPVLEPIENEKEALKIVNHVNLEDIIHDRKKIENIKQNIDGLKKKYTIGRSGKRRKLY